MNRIQGVIVAIFCASALLCQGCTKDEKVEIKEEVKDAGDSVEKAYDRTTDAMRDVVEGVNDAVYK